MKRRLYSGRGNAAVLVVLLFLGLISILAFFFGQSEFPDFGYILFMGAVFAALFSAVLLLFNGRTRTFVLLGLLGVWLLAGIFSREYFFYGAQIASGYIAPYLSQITHLEFAALPDSSPESLQACADFCVYCVFPYTGVLAWAVVLRKSALLSLLLTVPLFALSYGGLSRPAGVPLALLFVFWIAMILQSRVLRESKDVKPGFSLLCIALAAGVFCTLFAVFPQENYVASKEAVNLRLDITNAAMDFGYSIRGLRGFPSGTPLSSSDGTVSLDTAGSVQFADREIMRVHCDQPASLYLRGYSASVYTGHEWLQPDESAFAESGAGIEPLQYLGTENLLSPGSATTTVTVEPDRTDSNFLFTPYLLVDITSADPSPSWYGDAYLAADGQASYTFETYNTYGGDAFISADNANNLWQLSMNLPQYRGSMELDGHTFQYEVFSVGGILYPEEDDVPPATMEDAQTLLTDVFFMGGIPPDGVLQPQENPDDAYFSYIQNEYTQLPDGLRETLLSWWNGLYSGEGLSAELQPFYEASGDIPPHYWETAAKLVAKEISSAGVYTTNPGPQPLNRDFVEYFLTEGKQGYCIHYASAATAMLRALGIPARYVEGYVVGKDSFGADGWASVSANQAHSWTEIWMPGIGWIPVESTPGGTAASAVAAPSSAQDAAPTPSAAVTPPPSEPAETPTPAPTPQSPGGPGGARQAAGTGYAALTALLAAAAILIGIPFICRQAGKKKRSRLMDDPDPNRAALGIYTYLSDLRAFGGKISPEAEATARRAKFSRNGVTAEELAFLRNEAAAERARVAARLSRGKRFLLWIKGL